MASVSSRPMRADARRNRAAILQATGELLAARGTGVSMEEIAHRAGLGMGTLYRHFATKEALWGAIVAERFGEMVALARAAAEIEDPGEAFVTLVRTYLEAAERDQAYRLALLGPELTDWAVVGERKTEFRAAAGPLLRRAVAAGRLPADFGLDDFTLITRGVMANMTPYGDWRRHLELTLRGLVRGD